MSANAGIPQRAQSPGGLSELPAKSGCACRRKSLTKDRLALWDTLVALGYQTEGLYLGLGIGDYSSASERKVSSYAAARALPLRIVHLEEEGDGLAIPGQALLVSGRR